MLRERKDLSCSPQHLHKKPGIATNCTTVTLAVRAAPESFLARRGKMGERLVQFLSLSPTPSSEIEFHYVALTGLELNM